MNIAWSDSVPYNASIISVLISDLHIIGDVRILLGQR